MIVGILLGLGASASWAVANVAIQRSGRRVGPARAALWSQAAGGTGAALVGLLVDARAAAWTGATTRWAVAGGGAALLAYAGLFVATERGRLSIVIPVISSWAVLAAAVGIVILGERVHAVQLAGAVLVVAGSTLVARGAGERTSSERGALPAACAAAVGFGVLVPATGQLAPAAGSLGAVAVLMGIELLMAVPIGLVLRFDLRPPERSAWPPVLAAGLFEVLGFVCVALAAGRAPVAVVSPAASIGGALTVAWAWLVLGEQPGPVPLAGAALSAVGVVALSL